MTFPLLKATVMSGLRDFSKHLFQKLSSRDSQRNRVLSPLPLAAGLVLLRYDGNPLSALEIGEALELIHEPIEKIVETYTIVYDKMNNNSLISTSNHVSIRINGQEHIGSNMTIGEIIDQWRSFHVCYKAIQVAVANEKPEIHLFSYANYQNKFHYEVSIGEALRFVDINGNGRTMTSLQQIAILRFGVIGPLKATVVEVPTSDEDTLLYIIYPFKSEKGILEVEKNLRKFPFSVIKTYLKNTKLILILPKIELRAQVPLKQTLKSMGMRQMFNDMCNHIEGVPVKVMKILSAASFVMDENSEGVKHPISEDAQLVAKLPKLIVKHPFIFYVTSKEHEIYFEGKITKQVG
ncbi:serpin B8-like [Lucilia sericata]|uniref:serpin B8-like n=1 Tax=Lucilia sericata TaxID=13632 RepID=UPI0018A8134F|nr:serpin B8-like [Lucilia sericata]